MSERTGSKGKPPTKPHHPSRLRNEVHPDSLQSEHSDEEDPIQVFYSDAVVPETQLDSGDIDANILGDELMSPRSQALLSRTHVHKKFEPLSTPPSFQLSRPIQNGSSAPSSDFVFQPMRKGSSTSAIKKQPAPASSSNTPSLAPNVRELVGTASESTVKDKNRQRSEQAIIELSASSFREQQQSPDSTRPQPEAENVDLRFLPAVPDSSANDTPNRAKDGIQDLASHSNTEKPGAGRSGHIGGHAANPVATSRSSGKPSVLQTSKRTSKNHGKKERRPKPEQHYDASWLPGSMRSSNNKHAEFGTTSNAEVPSNPLESVENCSPFKGTPPLEAIEDGRTDVVRDLEERKAHQAGDTVSFEDPETMSKHVGESCQHQIKHKNASAENRPSPQAANDLDVPVVGEEDDFPPGPPLPYPLPDPAVVATNHVDELFSETISPRRVTDTAISAIAEQEDGLAAGQAHANLSQLPCHDPENDPEADGRKQQRGRNGKLKGRENRERLDERLHHTTSLRTGRISKARKKPRAENMAVLSWLKPGDPTLPELSSENDAFVKMLHLALSASERKTRDATDASAKDHETTISSLKATIGYQDNVIQVQKADTRKLQGEIKFMKEKVAILDKHANGIGQDYKRINGQVKDHHRSCSRILKEKLAEAESEKSSLVREFGVMLDSVEKSQRNNKSVLDDCYAKLVQSESRNKELVAQLCKQHSLYEDERKARAYLEQQLVPGLKRLQEDIGSSRDILAERMGRIEGSLHNTTATQQQEARIAQCIEALHSLKATSSVAAKEFHKIKQVLGLVQESIGTKLRETASSNTEKCFPLEDVRSCIRDQFLHLKSEVIKYDDAVAKSKEMDRANELLTKQIDTQEEQIKDHQQIKTTLESRNNQLERDVKALTEKVEELKSTRPDIEKALIDLRCEKEKAEEVLEAKSTELGRINDHLKEREDQLAAAKGTMASNETQIKDQGSHIAKLQQAKAAADEKLSKLEQNLSEQCMLAQGREDLKKQLVLKIVDCRRKETELTTSWADRQRLEDVITEMKTAKEKAHEELTSQTQAHEKDAATIRAFQGEAESWRKEKQDLKSSLEQSHTAVAKAGDAQERISNERNSLQHQMTEIRSLLKTTQQNLLEASEQTRNAKTVSESEIKKLKDRLQLADTAANRAELRAQHIADEKDRQLEDHKKSIDEKVERLVREKMALKEQERSRQLTPHQSVTSVDDPRQPFVAANPSIDATPNVHVARLGKKVTRNNTSVLGKKGPMRGLTDLTHPELHSSQSGVNNEESLMDAGENDEDSLAMVGDLENHEMLDENGVSFVGHNRDAEEDTQNSLTCGLDAFNFGMTQGSQYSRHPTSSSLSDPPSSGIIDMNEPNHTIMSTSISGTQAYLDQLVPRRSEACKTPVQGRHDPSRLATSQQSQDRPKSQANTGSRIAPPVPPFGQKLPGIPGHTSHMGARARTPTNGDLNTSSDAVSDEYTQDRQSGHTPYGRDVGAKTEPQSRKPTGTPIRNKESSRKRKSTDKYSNIMTPPKRHRADLVSSPSEAVSKTSQRSAPVPRGPTVRRAFNASPTSTQTQQAQRVRTARKGEPSHPSSAGPKRGKRTSKHSGDIERFERELRPAQSAKRGGLR